jgi:hypothetical protein
MKYLSTLALVMLMAAGLSAQTPEQQPFAALRELSGRVEIKAPGSAAWIPAEEGMAVEKTAVISTGFQGSALLVLENTRISIQPLTRLSLEEILERQGSEQVDLYLRTGRVRAEVRPPAGGRIDFTVRSPVATASVRGTVFDFDTVNLRVAEGRVQFAGASGSPVPVRRGESSSVNETASRASAPWEAQTAALAPALPLGTETGGAAAQGSRVPANSQGSLDLAITLEGGPQP